MRARILRAVALVAAAATVVSVRGQSSQTLTIAESEDSYRLSVPVSRLVMTIPKDDLEVADAGTGGGTASPRYFNLQDRARGIVVSGWFEPAGAYAGLDDFWKGEAAALRRNGFTPENIGQTKVDGWDVILYDMEIPRATNTHIRAEWVEQGTWIDIHISVTSRDRIEVARQIAMSVLTGIQVVASQ